MFLDANVMFSACCTPAGWSAHLIQLAGLGRAEIVASRYALDEAERNLRLKRPSGLGELDRVRQAIVTVPEPTQARVADARRLGLPIADAPILAAAASAQADVLVTGDARHFGPFYGAECLGVTVLQPRDAVLRVLRK